MPTAQDTAHRARDRAVTALKSQLFACMTDAARDLRARDDKLDSRLFMNLGPIGVRIVVGMEKDTFDAAQVETVNQAMADAIERAMNVSLSRADKLLGVRGIFMASYGSDGDPVRVTVVVVIRP